MGTARQIEKADMRIKAVCNGVITTPMLYSSALSELTGCRVMLKCEQMQRTGSFKFRGALNKLAQHYEEVEGVTAASTGNHGMGVARAARLLGLPARIFVPADASPAKTAGIEREGAQLIKVDGDCLAAELTARRTAEAENLLFVSPYNDLEIMHGQGSIGLEIAQQAQDADAVYISVGGGGLIGGVGSALKAVRPQIEIVGCWARNSPVLYQCMDAGRIIAVDEQETLSDATAGNLEEGSVTLPVCRRVIDRRILVSEAEIAQAMQLLAYHERLMVEGAAALAFAALYQDRERLAGKTAVVVLCGRNITLEKFLSVIGGKAE